MKKIIALFITLIYASVNAGFAFSELYYLKNIQANQVETIVKSEFSTNSYTLKNENPIYGVLPNSEDYALVILQQSGANVFYFYNSNNNRRINKNILKSIKNNGIEYEQSQNSNVMAIYENLAQNTISSNYSNNYVFSDNEMNNYQQQAPQIQNNNAFTGYIAQLAKGTSIPIYLQNAINTANANVGDRVVGVITNDVTYNGNTVFPQGSVVYGVLKTARHASYGSRNGRVVINFNQIVTPDNKTYNISTEEIDFSVTNDGKVAHVAGDAIVGALIGGLFGLLIGSMTGNIGSATAIGAGVGAGGALIGDTAGERGVDAEIPSFTEMELILSKPVNVSINY